MRLVVADDHPFMRAGLQAALEGTRYEIVGLASDGAEAIDLAKELNPDILLMDVAMPRLTGIEALAVLRKNGASPKVVLLTATLDASGAKEAISLGVEGIILKENGPSQLEACLEAVVRGERWIDAAVKEALTAEAVAETDEQAELGKLTQRERAVADLIAEGLHNKEVAEKLNLTEGTVKVYLSRIYEKLELSSRTELALFIREHSPPVGARSPLPPIRRWSPDTPSGS